MGSILSGANVADIRHRIWASSLSVYLANTSVVVVLVSSARVNEVCVAAGVLVETVCKKVTEIRRWNDNVIYIS